MVDISSQLKLKDIKYTPPTITQPVPSLKELHRQYEPLVFSSRQVTVHDCREPTFLEQRVTPHYEASNIIGDVREVYTAVQELHKKGKVEPGEGKSSKPDKLLYTIGHGKGSKEDQFNFPRAIASDTDGDLLIADTMNHRIMRYNQCGVFIDSFGKKGSNRGEFNQPTGVAVLDNDDIVCSDRKNKRIQILRPNGKCRSVIQMNEEPFSVACDMMHTIIVATGTGFIEVYDQTGNQQSRFKPTNESVPVQLCVNDNEEIIVCDKQKRMVKFYSYEGELYSQFPICSNKSGLVFEPVDIAVNPIGHVLVGDGLNHLVNVYTETGEFLEDLVGPTDDAGSIQSLTVGSEGHLVVAEFTTNGPHYVKIFRYRECLCHRSRPGSSKRSSRNQTPRSARY